MAEKDYGPRLGADPELFIESVEDQRVIPICGKIGGTKDKPLVISHIVDNLYGGMIGRREREPGYARVGDYAVQEDNVMLEFNIPAFRDSAYFSEAISRIMGTLDSSILPGIHARARIEAMYAFKPEELAPHPQAFTIGCSPDIDAYGGKTGQTRPPFNSTVFGNNRFCGGHLHVEYNKNNVPPHVFAQFMDLAVSLPFIRYDKQGMRRMFYGQPGIYRDKAYGIEYRTPSNFWLKPTFRQKYLVSMAENIFSIARAANENPEVLKKAYSLIDWDDVQQAIKTENSKLATELMDFTRNKTSLSLLSA